VHGSNARYLSVKLSLAQLAKMLCLSYYCLCLLFNKIGEKSRTGSAWKQGGSGEREGAGGRGEKWPKQCMHIWINEFKKENVHKKIIPWIRINPLF
jgi:hypothetical protein